MRRILIVVLWGCSVAAVLTGCGDDPAVSIATGTALGSGGSAQTLDVAPAELTETGDACVEFYKAAQESTIEEAIYMRAFADRVEELGHAEAGALLDELATTWETGIWEEGEDETSQSASWARVGTLLGEAGAIRCTDLAEWWGIEGYEGEPEPEAMLERQARIWMASQPSEYYLLVSGSADSGAATQVQIHIIDGVVAEVRVPAMGSAAVDELATSIDGLYWRLLDGGNHRVHRYDLAMAVPISIEFANGDRLIVEIDTSSYPPPRDAGFDREGG